MIRRDRGFSGRGTLPSLFLLVTFGLILWLGYQALDAGTSHRRTAEAVLSDYAEISADQFSHTIRTGVHQVRDDALGQVWRYIRTEPNPSPLPVAWDLDDAMRAQGCDCPGIRSPQMVFLVESDGSARRLQVLPDTLGDVLESRFLDRLLPLESDSRRRVAGLHLLQPDRETGGVDGPPGVLLYESRRSRSGSYTATYGALFSWAAVSDLLNHWYESQPLLPEPIAGGLANDSSLFVSVESAGGETLFASSIRYPTTLAATTTLESELGNLVVRSAIRPDAADQLIIGGLPNSKLPLLAVLILITMGVGIASVVQFRREQRFQRLRDDFVSGVSHELRTPLAQIRMFAELQESGKLTSEEDRSRAISVVHREARRLSHLVENILQYSSANRSSGRPLPVERLDLAVAIEDGIDAMTPMLHDHGAEVRVRVSPGVWVAANREAITRIVVNLLDNALKYGPTGQTIQLAVEPAPGLDEDSTDDGRPAARLIVEDEGPGIPESQRKKVWKAYQRLDRDVREGHPGTGIGLSVVAGLVSRLAGRAWVEEADSGGARFVVEIPQAHPAQAQPEPPSTSAVQPTLLNSTRPVSATAPDLSTASRESG